MNKYILALCCMNSFCLGINLPWSSGGSIEADMTIKNPEKFAQGKLVPQYLDKATTYLSNIIKDTSLNEENIKARKRDAKKDRDLYNTLNSMDRNLQNVNDRLNALSRCLKYSTGQDYYVAIKNKYFKNINGIKDKASDPFNILKSDATNIEQNRDCLYRFLSWNVPGNKSVADLRKMSAREIMAEISNVKQLAINKGLDPNVSYVKLMREIGAFFNDELSKLEYDAFVDGPAALGRLVITDKKTREALLQRLKKIYIDLWAPARLKLSAAQTYLSTIVEKWECPICLGEDAKNLVQTKCGHTFHKKCLDAWKKKNPKNPTCPVCRAKL